MGALCALHAVAHRATGDRMKIGEGKRKVIVGRAGCGVNHLPALERLVNYHRNVCGTVSPRWHAPGGVAE